MPLIGTITSLQNPHIKLARRLKIKKRDRYRERQYMVEGYRLVRHVVSRGYWPAFAFYSPDFRRDAESASLVDTLTAGDTRVWEVTPEILAEIADTVTPQGIVAIMPMPEPDPSLLQQSRFVLILDQLRMPGNLGTILRTALATGVGGIVCTAGTVDAYGPKVVRSAMGAHVDLSILIDAAWEQVASLTEGKQCVLAEAGGTTSFWEIDWTVPTALIIGSEAQGPSDEARQVATHSAYIPMTQAAESLNAAVAAAGFLFEAQRQRLSDAASS